MCCRAQIVYQSVAIRVGHQVDSLPVAVVVVVSEQIACSMYGMRARVASSSQTTRPKTKLTHTHTQIHAYTRRLQAHNSVACR